jgi:hypothetical protein
MTLPVAANNFFSTKPKYKYKHLDPEQVFQEIQILREEVQAVQRAIAAIRRELPSMVSESMLQTLNERNRRSYPF